jgi:Lysine methyltransferase
VIEQDKTLGKGGLCWDAAFVLADYLSTSLTAAVDSSENWKNHSDSPVGKVTSVVELGAGTGVCGLLLSKQVDCLRVALTDLPILDLQSLLIRNVERFRHGPGDNDSILSQYLERNEKMEKSNTKSTSSIVEVYPLDWADTESSHGPFDVVLGADVVASLYDPVALAHTVKRLCHDETRVYISFKERLSTIHRQFEEEMSRLFSEVRIIDQRENGQPMSRNRNPDVRILIAKV